ncbi:MAG: hypothetical protein M0R51_16555, partial [Clostridia bacterium]|nr:hypothetical protein [Clostridia bacterium]
MTGRRRLSIKDKTNIKKGQTRKETYLAIQRGELLKYPCILCGNNIVEAHHTSYNDYRHIIWLCHDCHVKIHRYLRLINLEVPIDLATNSRGGREILRIGYPGNIPTTLSINRLKLQWDNLVTVFKDEITFAHLIINELLLCTCGDAPLKESKTKYLKVIAEGEYCPDRPEGQDMGHVIYLYLGGTDDCYYTPRNINLEHLYTAWNACIIDEYPTLMHLIFHELLV